jgi:phosphoribosyl 1,2-cyclic phosphate phosphodiesterase
MRVRFLGTGTSHGVPVIGCNCRVCTSSDPRDKRTRSSLLVETENGNILIDTATEFRLQAIREGLDRVDSVLYTHCHADHVFGFDDLRRFNELQDSSIPCYAKEDVIEDFRRIFDYVFLKTQIGGGKPQVELNIINGPFSICGQDIIPVKIFHGCIEILGYRIGKMAYITDCSSIPEGSLQLLKDLDLLILGALRYRPHPTHFSINEALKAVELLSPKRAFFTHICHDLHHEDVSRTLPPGTALAYDGLVLEV